MVLAIKNPLAVKLGKRLRMARKRAGHSVKGAGKMINAAESTISGYENGHRLPNLKVLKKLAVIYKTSLNDLTDGLIDPASLPTIDAEADVKDEKQAREDPYILSEVQDAAAKLGAWGTAQELAEFSWWALGRLNRIALDTAGHSGRERGEVLRQRLRDMRQMWEKGER